MTASFHIGERGGVLIINPPFSSKAMACSAASTVIAMLWFALMPRLERSLGISQ